MPTVDLSTATWRKSRRSSNAGSGDNCVELAFTTATWRKSSRSGNAGSGDNCVEVARPGAVIALRDSKAPSHGALIITPDAWSHFGAQLHQA